MEATCLPRIYVSASAKASSGLASCASTSNTGNSSWRRFSCLRNSRIGVMESLQMSQNFEFNNWRHTKMSKKSVACVQVLRAKLNDTERKTHDDDDEYPWPQKFGTEDLEGSPLPFLSRFKPLPNKPKTVTLPFEIPLLEIEKNINKIRETAKATGMDFSEQVNELQRKYDEMRKELYGQLSPVQRLSVARHPHRPTFLEHILNITDKWLELHGDRAGCDDPAIVTGIGTIDGMSFMFIGHQKGRNTKENIYRNFAMPGPEGYRKALRMMRHAEHHGFPILTFVDTPGAYAGLHAEEHGQGEAIAKNLREMFGLRVPIITTVIGEGGSGGALGIGCCDKMLMLENSVYFVASPEACAAILWRTADAAPKATEAMKITAHELVELDVVDEVVKEPLGGAHGDPYSASQNLKEAIMRHMKDLLKLDPDSLLKHRKAKFRKIGAVQEGVKLDPRFKRKMKPRDAHLDGEQPPQMT